MATIKRSEVEQLRRDSRVLETVVADRDYWLDEAWSWEQKAIIASVRTNELKNKLWAAEQEIHDLKVALERQRENALEIVAQQEKEIQKLVNLSVDLVARHFDPNWPIEQIDPPTCLNGFDALKWSAARAYEPNSGPY